MAFRHVNNVNHPYFTAPEQFSRFYVNTYTGRRAAFS
jgi:hypothetical protein